MSKFNRNDVEDKNIAELLKNMKYIAENTPHKCTLVKIPEEFYDNPGKCFAPVPIVEGYAIYFKGEMIPCWVEKQCDECQKKNCHFIWDTSLQKWKMVCVDHFDQFMK